jgi:hypothetical protein
MAFRLDATNSQPESVAEAGIADLTLPILSWFRHSSLAFTNDRVIPDLLTSLDI